MTADKRGDKTIYTVTDGPGVRVSVHHGPQVAAEFTRIGWRMEQVRPERKPAEPALAGLVNAFERGELPAWAAAWGQPWPLPEEQAARGASPFPWLDGQGDIDLPRLPRQLLWHLAPSPHADTATVSEDLKDAAIWAVLCLVDAADLGDLQQNATWSPSVEEAQLVISSWPMSATPSERLWSLRLPPFADAAASRVAWMPSFKSRSEYGRKLPARNFSQAFKALGREMVPTWLKVTDSLLAVVQLELLEAIVSGATLRRCAQLGCNRAFLAETRLHDFCHLHSAPAFGDADALRVKRAYDRYRQLRGEAALPFEEWRTSYKPRGRSDQR